MKKPELKITSVAKPKVTGTTTLWPINVCRDEVSNTITAHEGGRCLANFLTLAHYPMTAILIEYDGE